MSPDHRTPHLHGRVLLGYTMCDLDEGRSGSGDIIYDQHDLISL